MLRTSSKVSTSLSCRSTSALVKEVSLVRSFLFLADMTHERRQRNEVKKLPADLRDAGILSVALSSTSEKPTPIKTCAERGM